MIQQKRSLATVFALVGGLVLGSIRSHAQTPQKPNGAKEVLANFEEFSRTRRGGFPDEVRHPERYTAERVDSVLRGLERIALSGEPKFVGSTAAASLSRAGSLKNPPKGVFDRQLRVYGKSKEPLVRLTILNRMFEQNDRTRSLAFLKSVAGESTDHQDFEDAALSAVDGLSRMGPAGRAALIDLRDKKLLRDGKAIGFVNWVLTQK